MKHLKANVDDIKQEIENSIKEIRCSSEYIINDQVHNLTNGILKTSLQHHLNINHRHLFKKR